jgi:pyruvate dehydrogenase E2 component (dihydrolipoamide acetyltransferase)
MEHILEIPSLGEGTEDDGTIIDIPIKVGDTIRIGDTLLEIETDKVTLEIPAEHEGVIEEILINTGVQAKVGKAFARLKLKESTVTDRQPGVQRSQKSNALSPVDASETADPILIPISSLPGDASTGSKVSSNKLSSDLQKYGSTYIRANPGARRLAREIGVNLAEVDASGKRVRVTAEDVKNHARHINLGKQVESGIVKNGDRPLPDFREFGSVSRETMSRVAITTSHNMNQSWSRIPHAWLQQSIDITELEEWRQQQKVEVKKQGGTLTITVILAKVIAIALNSFPKLKSSVDETTNEIVYKNYTDIGIAVDTGDALVVPTLRQVDKKGLVDLSTELSTLSEKARTRKLSPKEMQGAGITISNLGGIGLDAIFPIVNWPQVAIVGVAASTIEPVYIDNEFFPRRRLKVTLGFDHRIINGAEGARFLVHLKDLLEDTRLMLL